MNTPTHLLVNLVLLRRFTGLRGRGDAGDPAPIASGRDTAWVCWGALLPDLPMLVFWVIQTLGLGRPQREIWSTVYFDPSWQQVFDAFNSVPIYAVLAVGAWLTTRPALLAASLSALLHIAMDLPLHREDAHAHFWPLTDWHFVSPVSYWNPAHHGTWVSTLELALLTGCALWIWPQVISSWGRSALAVTVSASILVWVALRVF